MREIIYNEKETDKEWTQSVSKIKENLKQQEKDHLLRL